MLKRSFVFLTILVLFLSLVSGCHTRTVDLKPDVTKTKLAKPGKLLPKKTAGGILFRFDKKNARNVYLAGTFNGWNASDPKFKMKKDSDGHWALKVKLKPGNYMYKYVADNAWWPDPDNPSRSEDGFSNSIIEINKKGEVQIHVGAYTRDNPGAHYKYKTANTSPDWIKRTIIYEMYIRVYTKEGTFKAAQKKLPYLKKLGVEVLWLMPIHPVGQKKKKGSIGCPYSVRDYRKVNPKWGTDADFKAFVDKAHALGFKVILDWVANHSSWDNWMIEKHPNWYTKKNGKIVPPVNDWWDVADLNYEDNTDNNSGFRKYMKDSLVYWVKNFNVDGFRCDVADMVPNDFWVSARKALKAVKPDIMMLAESEAPLHHTGGFDLTYEGATRNFIRDMLSGKKKAWEFEAFHNKLKYTYPKGSLRMRWLENHDQVHAIKYYNRKTVLPASALVFGMDGVPMLLMGQEFGDSKWKNWKSLFDKFTLGWDKFDQKLFDHYAALIKARKGSKALSEGGLVFLDNTNASRVVTFLRKAGKEYVVVAVNFSKKPADFDITKGSAVRAGMDAEYQAVELLSGKKTGKVKLGGMRIQLPPYGFAYYQLKG